MLVRCPQCQYANQIEADAAKPRIVCARCATVISIEFLASPRVPQASEASISEMPNTDNPLADLFVERRPSEPLFMKTPESPLDLDSLLETSVDEASKPPMQPLPPPPPMMTTPSLQDPLLEGHWEGDEILDIPRAAAAESQHDPLAVEDLLAPPPAEANPFDTTFGTPTEPLFSEPAPVLESHDAGATASLWSTPDEEILSSPAPAAEATNVHQAEYGKEEYATAAAAGAEVSAAAPSVFAQDSYTRTPANTYVVATPDGSNKGALAKIFLATAVLFALIGVAYFALSGPIKEWLGSRGNQQAANQNSSGQTGASSTAQPGATPGVAPSLGTKTGTDNKNVTASPQASPAASSSTKPTASPAATATPSPSAAPKTTPTPPPASSGTSGHAVGSGDGSLAIQIAAYRTPAEAQQAASKLKSAGVEARVIKAEVPGKGTYYRVQSGRFTSEADASKYAGELRAKGAIRDFIVAGYQAQ